MGLVISIRSWTNTLKHLLLSRQAKHRHRSEAHSRVWGKEQKEMLSNILCQVENRIILFPLLLVSSVVDILLTEISPLNNLLGGNHYCWYFTIKLKDVMVPINYAASKGRSWDSKKGGEGEETNRTGCSIGNSAHSSTTQWWHVSMA